MAEHPKIGTPGPLAESGHVIAESARHGYLHLLRLAANGWIEDRASSMGAALAYYTLFSMAPLLLIVIAIGGLVFGQEAARGAVLQQVGGIIGDQGAQAVQAALASSRSLTGGFMSIVIGSATVVLGATSVFNELKSDLDRVWKLPQTSGGIWQLVRTRLVAFGLVIGLGFLLLVSLIVSAMLSGLGSYLNVAFPGAETILGALYDVVSLAVITLIFGALYKLLPAAEIAWADVWGGAATTAALFTLGKYLIGLYIGKAAFGSSFGAAGAFVVLLVWAYYAAQIFLFGAEFTYFHARAAGRAPAGPPSHGPTA